MSWGTVLGIAFYWIVLNVAYFIASWASTVPHLRWEPVYWLIILLSVNIYVINWHVY